MRSCCYAACYGFVCLCMYACVGVCQIEATDKTASIKISFSAGTAAQDLSRKLRGVTVKIKGVKLHAFVRVREALETHALLAPDAAIQR